MFAILIPVFIFIIILININIEIAKSIEEIHENSIENNQEISSYEFVLHTNISMVNETLNMNITINNTKTGIIDLENNYLMLESIIDNQLDFIYHKFCIYKDNIYFKESANGTSKWVQKNLSEFDKNISSYDFHKLQIQLLENSEIIFLGKNTINDIECYELTLSSNPDILFKIISTQIDTISGFELSLENSKITSSETKQCVAKNSYYIYKIYNEAYLNQVTLFDTNYQINYKTDVIFSSHNIIPSYEIPLIQNESQNETVELLQNGTSPDANNSQNQTENPGETPGGDGDGDGDGDVDAGGGTSPGDDGGQDEYDTSPPLITNIDASPENQNQGGYVSITCEVQDDIAVAAVKVDISGPSGFTDINSTMNSGYYYNQQYTISGEYSYYIWASDASGNSKTSDTYTFSITDIGTPIIDDNTPTIGTTGEEFTFSATITDENGIDSVWVEYWCNDEYTKLEMPPTGIDDNYDKTITIPSDTIDVMTYNISANDLLDNWGFTGLQTVDITDNDQPEYTWNLQPETANTGDQKTVGITATDNIGISYYKIKIDTNEYTMTKTGNYYTYNINIPEDDVSDISYYCIFKDNYENKVSTDTITLSITDDDPPDYTWTSQPQEANTGDQVTVGLIVTDNIEVTTYQITVNTNEYTMIKNNDYYSYIINIPQDDDSDIIYSCTFRDEEENTVTTGDTTISVTEQHEAPPNPSTINVEMTLENTNLADLNYLTAKATTLSPLGINRENEPVTWGIPIPENLDITDIDTLRITDESDSTVPAQFDIISRWGDIDDTSKPIKWVLVSFQADVVNSADYYLKNDGSGNTDTGNIVTNEWYIDISEPGEVDSDIIIFTGVLEATISKNQGNILDKVRIDNNNDGNYETVIDSSTLNGIKIKETSTGTTYYSGLSTPDSLEVVYLGPMKTIIRVSGSLESPGGVSLEPDVTWSTYSSYYTIEHIDVKYDAYLTFYYNKDYIEVEITLEAPGNSLGNYAYRHLHTLTFESVGLEFDLEMSDSKTVNFESGTDTTSPSDTYYFLQSHTLNDVDNEENNFYYHLKKNSAVVGNSGIRTNGYADLSQTGDNSWGLTASVYESWQNWPKAFEITDNDFIVWLWPDTGGSYEMLGGYQKTHRVLLSFHDDSFNQEQIDRVKQFHSPLIPIISPHWYNYANAYGQPIIPENVDTGDSALNEMVTRWETIVDKGVDYSIGLASNSFITIKENRLNGIGPYMVEGVSGQYGIDSYGWKTFGDVVRRRSGTLTACANHYDFPNYMMMQFLRKGDLRFYVLADSHARHTRDMDINHGDYQNNGAERKYKGMTRWEDNPHMGGNIIPSLNNHRGLGYYYLLTGSPKFLETIIEFGNNQYFNVHNYPSQYDSELRRTTGTADMKIIYYEILGDSQYLDDALSDLKLKLITLEQDTTCGWGTGEGFSFESCTGWAEQIYSNFCGSCDGQHSLYAYTHGCGLRQLLPVTLFTDDSSWQAFLVRKADWYMNHQSKPEEISGNLISPVGFPYSINYNTGELEGTFYIAFDNLYTDFYAYMYELTENQEYLDYSIQLFKAISLYGGGPGAGDPAWRNSPYLFDSSIRSYISWWTQTSSKDYADFVNGGTYLIKQYYDNPYT